MNPHPRGELSLRISLFRLPLVQCTPPYTTTFDGVTTSSMAHEVQRPDDAGTIHHSEKQATTELLDVNQGPRQNTSTSTLEAKSLILSKMYMSSFSSTSSSVAMVRKVLMTLSIVSLCIHNSAWFIYLSLIMTCFFFFQSSNSSGVSVSGGDIQNL